MTARGQKSFVMVDFMDLDTCKFTFLKTKSNAHGGHYIPIRYNGKSLYVRYETRVCPFGISTGYAGNASSGHSTSISCHKDYSSDPYYLKAQELDQFFMEQCYENCTQWHLGGTSVNPLSRDIIEGYDNRGVDGKWKRLLKWSNKKDDIGERKYLDYPPRLQFGLPIDGGTYKSIFFNANGEKLDPVCTMDSNSVLPKFSRIALVANWSTLAQGTYGITLKPKLMQLRVYPSDSLPVDECLLDDDDEEEDQDNICPSFRDLHV